MFSAVPMLPIPPLKKIQGFEYLGDELHRLYDHEVDGWTVGVNGRTHIARARPLRAPVSGQLPRLPVALDVGGG